MDTRQALPGRTVLRFANERRGVVEYTIQQELARGGSCIVYDGFYVNNSGLRRRVRIKECCPFRLHMHREADGTLIPAPEDAEAFRGACRRMRSAFDLGNRLFSTDGLTNSVANTLDIYEGNNTVYIVSAYQQGCVLPACRFTALSECIAAVRSAARAVGRIHAAGYLYLDLKPENVFVLADTGQMVQLFDFDSLLPLPDSGKTIPEQDCRISYTQGYSALEHQMGRIRRLGRYTDVYSVGAVLFYLIFGRAPTADDCAAGAGFDYSSTRWACAGLHPGFWDALSDFFHRTLANYWADRYSCMEETTEALEALFRLADSPGPFLLSTRLSAPAFFVGRQKEAAFLDDWFRCPEQNCLVLSGMGGIGKSTFLRWYLSRHTQLFDTILYIPWEGSVRATLLNDTTVAIHGVERRCEETDEEYFSRKLRCLRTLVRSGRTVLAIDNFTGTADRDLAALTALNWQIILLTRQQIPAGTYPCLSLQSLSREADLRALFSHYCGCPLQEEDEEALQELFHQCARHTLTLELMARQIQRSHLTLPQAAALARSHGFSAMAKESVPFTRDMTCTSQTIRQILSALFSSHQLSQKSVCLLQQLALFPLDGVSLPLFARLTGEEILDDLNTLHDDGWLRSGGDLLSLHPVVREVVGCWSWTAPSLLCTRRMLGRLTELLEGWPPAQEYIIAAPPGQDFHRLHRLLQLARSLSRNCCTVPELRSSAELAALLCAMAVRFPREQEEAIIECAQLLLSSSATAPQLQLTLLEKLILICDERGDFDQSEQLLARAEALFPHPDQLTQARLLDIRTDLADARLSGSYEEENAFHDRRTLLHATRKALHLLARPRTEQELLLYIKHLLSMTILLLRTSRHRRAEARRLLDRTAALCREHHLEGTYVQRDLLMAQAWFALETGQEGRAEDCLQQACRMADHVCSTPLDHIDFVLLPAANILLNLGRCDDASAALHAAIRLCRRHPDVLPYVRKRMDLMLCLLDVFAAMDDPGLCRRLMEEIDRENDNCRPLGISAEIPPGLRARFSSHS